ncbi:MAG TPA: aminopeptidase P family N-terminal domain-containing protein, partial [Vicinamibacterales bacterium]|nr:aminopeptidase P family N-terminal domain-containing protein [Vicinamibacterales bacterium]
MQIAPPEYHLARHARVRADLRAASLDALVVTSLPNVAYLTGLFASAGAVIISQDRLVLIVDGRYAITARERRLELDAIEIVLAPTSGSYEEAIAAVTGSFANGRVGFEEAQMTVR